MIIINNLSSLHVEEEEVKLNYEKTLCVIAYRITIEGLLELNAKVPTFVQVRPVRETPFVLAPGALPRTFFVRRHFLCS